MPAARHMARHLLVRPSMDNIERHEDLDFDEPFQIDDPAPAVMHAALDLTLHVTDAELCGELEAHAEGRARHDYSVAALKIGALALRHAQGRIDAERIRNEGDRLIAELAHRLHEHGRAVNEQVASRLQEYFDPKSGRFNERVERLVTKDGELEALLRGQLSGDSSELARTLAAYVGEHSPIMQILDPSTTKGLVGSLAQSVETTLNEQRERILNEFSLDNGDGALARLVRELGERHGEVGEALEKRIAEVVSEFSLDREDSALSRLVRRVETAQRQISKEFSLDEEGSALAQNLGDEPGGQLAGDEFRDARARPRHGPTHRFRNRRLRNVPFRRATRLATRSS